MSKNNKELISHWGYELPQNIVKELKQLEQIRNFQDFKNAYDELLKIAKKRPKTLVKYFEYLIDAYFQNDECDEIYFSLFWLASILAESKAKEAIYPIAELVTVDGDQTNEMVEYALTKLGQTYPEEVVDKVIEANEIIMIHFRDNGSKEEDYNEGRFGSFRIYYYGVLEEFAKINKKAKDYLMKMFFEEMEVDDSGGYSDAISTFLSKLEDRRILELFKGRLHYLELIDCKESFQYNELKSAYYILDKGPEDCNLFYDPWDSSIDWQKPCFVRFKHFIEGWFKKLKKEEKDELLKNYIDWEKEQPIRGLKHLDLGEKDFKKKMEKEKKEVLDHPIDSFDIEKYLEVAPVFDALKECAKFFKKIGIQQSLKKLQIIIHNSKQPEDAVNVIFALNPKLQTEDREVIEKAVVIVASLTPMGEEGITLHDHSNAMKILEGCNCKECRKDNSEEGSEIVQNESKPKIGRNEKCPCGSGLKYKKCCIDKSVIDGEVVDTPRCGLCSKTDRVTKLTRTNCCDEWICDDEENYELFSYAHNSCIRNHRRYTLCGLHNNEDHDGNWQDCNECKRDVDKTEMYVWYGTNEYNFEKLKNPPKYEPTKCSKCSSIIKLSDGGYSRKGEDFWCENCG